MEGIQFIELDSASVLILFLVGFIGGMVSGFIGSGGAFVLTPAMMSLGVPAAVAVASNMAHKFPNALARWVRTLHIPGTMVYFRSIDAKLSFLVIAPLGFATGLLAASIAVGGFIGVPAMMYVLGLPALIASATELVVAFVMGMGGSFFCAMDGFVDIRLSMIILAGSLFGIQIGAIGTTYVKDYLVKSVMAVIMLLVLVSRFFYIPGYLSELGTIEGLAEDTADMLNAMGQGTLTFALVFGAGMILQALYRGMREHRLTEAPAPLATAGAAPVTLHFAPEKEPKAAPRAAQAPHVSPLGRFDRFLVATDGSRFADAAVVTAANMAGACGARVTVVSVNTPSYSQARWRMAQDAVEQAVAHMRGEGLAAEAVLGHGHPYEVIVGVAREQGADLIVTGSHGHTGFQRVLLGSTSERILNATSCAVLVVK